MNYHNGKTIETMCAALKICKMAFFNTFSKAVTYVCLLYGRTFYHY